MVYSSPLLKRPYTYVLTAAADYLPAALDEVRRLDSNLHQIMEPDREIAIVESTLDLGAMHAGLQQHPPIFLRHIAPAQSRVILAGAGSDLGDLARETLALPELAALEPGMSFSVQARVIPNGGERAYTPYSIKSAIVPLVAAETGAQENVRAPEIVVSVLALPSIGFVGISPVTFNLSDWAGGARRFSREPGQVSRAEFKLLEAMDVFGVTLPASGTALDLGAAPGGWTRLLRQAGLKVMAVDPAPLDPTLQQDRDVRAVQGHAEEWVERLKRANVKFDVVVNDVHTDARDSARLMVEAALLMRLDSFGILTLNLPSVAAEGMDPVAITHEALDLLRARYRTVRARQLFHNRNEVTVLLRP